MMRQTLFWQAMRAMLTAGLVIFSASILVVLPSITVIGGLLTILLLISLYPLGLVIAYLVVGWQAAKRLGTEAAALPRWRAGLTLGGGGAMAMTLGSTLGGTVAGLIVSAFLGSVFAATKDTALQQDAGATFVGLMALSLVIVAIYLLAGLSFGTLCSWGMACWQLGQQRIATPHAADAEFSPTPDLAG